MAFDPAKALSLEEAAQPLIDWLSKHYPDNTHRALVQPPGKGHPRWCVALESREHLHVGPAQPGYPGAPRG